MSKETNMKSKKPRMQQVVTIYCKDDGETAESKCQINFLAKPPSVLRAMKDCAGWLNLLAQKTDAPYCVLVGHFFGDEYPATHVIAKAMCDPGHAPQGSEVYRTIEIPLAMYEQLRTLAEKVKAKESAPAQEASAA